MADTTGVLTSLQSIADRLIRTQPEFVSKIFDRSTILSLLRARGGGDTSFRPGAFTLVGGGNLGRARREELKGAEKVYLPAIHTGTVGGTKLMAARDTGPSISSPTTNTAADKFKRGFVQKCKLHTPVLIWNTDLEATQGKYSLISLTERAVGLAMEEQGDEIRNILLDGDVDDDTADIWNGQYGITSVCDTDNKIYGIDRNGVTYFDGKLITASTSAALAMVDQANITEGIYKNGPGIDALICNPTAYNTIKAEALAKGGTLLHRGTPEALRNGVLNEAVMYGSVIITLDYSFNNFDQVGSSGGMVGTDLSNACVGLTLGDWVFLSQDGERFSIGAFTDLEQTAEGGKDAKHAVMKTHFRLWCEKPWNQILWTTVA